MKFTLFAAASAFAFAGVALAASAAPGAADAVAEMPECIQDCLSQGLKGAGCSSTDYDCGCQKYEKVTLDTSSCLAGKVLTGCNISGVSDLGNELCTNFTDGDVENIRSAYSSLTSLPTSVDGIVSPSGASGAEDAPAAGPQVAPMAWAGASVAMVAVFAMVL